MFIIKRCKVSFGIWSNGLPLIEHECLYLSKINLSVISPLGLSGKSVLRKREKVKMSGSQASTQRAKEGLLLPNKGRIIFIR